MNFGEMRNMNPTAADNLPEKVIPTDFADETVETKPTRNPGDVLRTVAKRKWLALCIVLSILLIFTITTILLLAFLRRQDVIIYETSSRHVGNMEVNEVAYLDSVESLMQYHFVNDGEETWVILDLNRDLEIMKTKKDAGPAVCYLFPIAALDPQFSSSSSGNDSSNDTSSDNHTWKNRSTVVDYKRSRFPLKDKSVLGPKGVALCEDVEVFWSLPLCNDGSRNEATGSSPGQRRRKRSTWVMWCRWDWSNCYNFSFEDKSYRIYYRCDITCSWVWV